MISFIKNHLAIYRIAKSGAMNVAWCKILQSLMDFAVQVQQHGKPMLTKIAVADMSKDKIIGNFDMVSIWAGVGGANPIERIKHLKAQNTALKELLTKCKSTLEIGGNNDLIINIKLVLDAFE